MAAEYWKQRKANELMTQREINMLGSGALAYLGDSVLEVMIREMLIKTGVGDAGALNRMARNYEKATAQSAGIEKIMPLLTENEQAIYRRGRNGGSNSHPKSATVQEYRRATGFEALFGYLYLAGEAERLQELFRVYAGELENT